MENISKKTKMQKSTIKMLTQALEAIKTVDYPVSLRWIYYRLIDNYGWPKCLKTLNKLTSATSVARKEEQYGWDPDTLTDETRQIYYPAGIGISETKWIQNRQKQSCTLDKGKPPRIIVIFEARAMLKQFEKYTAPYHVTLVPLAGDASISLKSELSKLLAEFMYEAEKDGTIAPENYTTVLYFGDRDAKGDQIPETARKDIEKFIHKHINLAPGYMPYNWIRCGLSTEQATKLKLTTDPERKGKYQWEALTDPQAREIIEDSLNKYVDLEHIAEVENRETELAASLQAYMKAWIPPTGSTQGGETN